MINRLSFNIPRGNSAIKSNLDSYICSEWTKCLCTTFNVKQVINFIRVRPILGSEIGDR